MNSKVSFPILVADAPARAMLTNLKQFNGCYGGGYCKHEGINATKPTSNPLARGGNV